MEIPTPCIQLYTRIMRYTTYFKICSDSMNLACDFDFWKKTVSELIVASYYMQGDVCSDSVGSGKVLIEFMP